MSDHNHGNHDACDPRYCSDVEIATLKAEVQELRSQLAEMNRLLFLATSAAEEANRVMKKAADAAIELAKIRQAATVHIDELLSTTMGREPSPGWLDARERAVAFMEGQPVPLPTVSLRETMNLWSHLARSTEGGGT